MARNPAIRPQLFDDEPAFSWFLRWTAMQGQQSARVFAHHLGLPLHTIYTGLANSQLARIAGLPQDSFERNTIVRRSHSDASFRGLRFPGHLISSRVTRFCIECVRDDLGKPLWPGEPRARFRTGWLMQCITACPVHGVLLTETGKGGTRLARHPQDILRDIDSSGPIPDGQTSPRADAGADAYLLGRMCLSPAVPSPILDACQFHELPRLLERVGMLALGMHSAPRNDIMARNQAVNAGFNVLRTEEGFDGFLSRLSTAHREEAKRFAPFLGYSRLGPVFGYSPFGDRFLAVRRAVARHASENAGASYAKEIYGIPVTPRTVRLSDFSESIGRGTEWCIKMLQHGGLLDPDYAGEYLDASVTRKFEALLSDLIEFDEAVALLGMLPNTVNLLQNSGVIQPWTHGLEGQPKRLYRRSQVEAFVQAVRQGKRAVYIEPPEGLVPISQAKNYMGASYSQLLPGLASGLLRCRGLLHGLEGVEAVLVSREEVIRFTLRDEDTVTTAEAARILAIPQISITGLRESGRLGPNERRGRRHVLKRAYVEEFGARFVSSHEAGKRLAVDASGVRYPLSRLGVDPSFRARGGGWFYDRKKFEDAIQDLGAEIKVLVARRKPRRNESG